MDLEALLARPGVRAVAVEFYATWCKPCMAAVPRWKELREQYHQKGLRLIVVNTLDPGGECATLPWAPDGFVCDPDGRIANAIGVGGRLPSAFLWTWQGKLLVRDGHVGAVASEVRRYLAASHRVAVEAVDSHSRPAPALAALLRAELARTGKLTVVSGDGERAHLQALRKESHSLGRRSDQRCDPGKEVSPNTLLRARLLDVGRITKLFLSVHTIETGCLQASIFVPAEPGQRQDSIRIAVRRLLDALRSPLEFPERLALRGRSTSVSPQWLAAQRAGRNAVVTFAAQPAGAMVLIDGKLVCRRTPCSRAVTTGRHSVSMQLEGHVAREAVLDLGKGSRVAWRLPRNQAFVSVDTVPEALRVMVDGKPVGESPIAKLRLKPGSHVVQVSGPCHRRELQAVQLEPEQARQVAFKPRQRVASLAVQARSPNGDDVAARVYVDGRLVGDTPGVFALPLCSKQLQIRHHRHGKVRRALALHEKRKRLIAVTFDPRSTSQDGGREGTSIGHLDPSGAPITALALKEWRRAVARARLLSGEGRFGAAAASVAIAVKRSPKHLPTRLLLATTHHLAGSYRRATAAYDDVTKMAPDSGFANRARRYRRRLLKRRTILLAAAGDVERATAALHQLRGQANTALRDLLAIAATHMCLNARTAARKALLDFVVARPSDQRAVESYVRALNLSSDGPTVSDCAGSADVSFGAPKVADLALGSPVGTERPRPWLALLRATVHPGMTTMRARLRILMPELVRCMELVPRVTTSSALRRQTRVSYTPMTPHPKRAATRTTGRGSGIVETEVLIPPWYRLLDGAAVRSGEARRPAAANQTGTRESSLERSITTEFRILLATGRTRKPKVLRVTGGGAALARTRACMRGRVQASGVPAELGAGATIAARFAIKLWHGRRRPVGVEQTGAALVTGADFRREARLLSAEGKLSEAGRVLSAALEAGYAGSHAELARIFFLMGDKVRCASHARKYIDLYDERPDALAAERLLFHCSGRF